MTQSHARTPEVAIEIFRLRRCASVDIRKSDARPPQCHCYIYDNLYRCSSIKKRLKRAFFVDGPKGRCYAGAVRDAECRPKGLPRRDVRKQAELFKVLADPHRLKILAAIARSENEVCVCDLTSGLPLLQPTVSHHLRVLRETGLVTSERRGTWVYYRLAPGALQRMHDAIDQISGAPPRALRRTG